MTIVENSGAVGGNGGGWSVASEPRLTIGTFDGDSTYQLFQVQGAARLSDGRIAVGNSGTGEIRLFDGEGRFLEALGRKGEGPEEFQRPALVGVRGADSLVVVDFQLRRISFVRPGIGFVGSARIAEEMGGGLFPQGMFGDGAVVVGGGFYFSSDGGVELSNGYSRRATAYFSTGPDGNLVTDFGQFPGSEFFMQVQSSAGGAVSMMARLIPFGKYAMQAVGPDHLFLASGDSWEVKAFDPSGELTRIIRLDRTPTPVRDADLDAYIEEEVADASDPSQAQEIRSNLAEIPVPDFMPAFAGLRADALGYLWVERYRRPGEDAQVFDIIDPDGALVGTVALPVHLDVMEIGEDYILGLFRDDLEVEYVRMYDLTRPNRGE